MPFGGSPVKSSPTLAGIGLKATELNKQRRTPAATYLVDVSTGVQQQTHDFHMTTLARRPQRTVRRIVEFVDIDFVPDQHAHEFKVPFLNGAAKRSQTISVGVASININVASNQNRLGSFGVTFLDGLEPSLIAVVAFAGPAVTIRVAAVAFIVACFVLVKRACG